MRIVAIGGGDRGPAMWTALEGMDNTRALIIPSACSTPDSYNKKVPNVTTFFRNLGIANTVLHELGQDPSPTKIAEEIGRAGLLYVIGGHTLTMLSRFEEHGTGDAIIQAVAHDGKTIAGVSAGALAPFQVIHSNPAKRPKEEKWDFVQLSGLSLLRAAATAHANQHDPTSHGPRPDSRMENLMATFPGEVPVGIAIDHQAALIVEDDYSLIVRSGEGRKSGANVHVLTPIDGMVTATPIEDAAHITSVVNAIVAAR